MSSCKMYFDFVRLNFSCPNYDVPKNYHSSVKIDLKYCLLVKRFGLATAFIFLEIVTNARWYYLHSSSSPISGKIFVLELLPNILLSNHIAGFSKCSFPRKIQAIVLIFLHIFRHLLKPHIDHVIWCPQHS